MFSKSFVKRAGAAALSLVMAVSLVPCAGAVDPLVDESYYGTLDYYGGLTDGSVVKSYRLNGNMDLADVGSYTEVNNLTDRTEPTVEGERVTFHLTDESLKVAGRHERPVEVVFGVEATKAEPHKVKTGISSETEIEVLRLE